MESGQQQPDSNDHQDDSDLDLAERVGRWLAVPLVLALVAGAVLIVIGITPHKVPLKQNAGFLDVIFASRTVVAVTRIVVLFAAGYFAWSVIKLILAKRYLTGFGPFGTAEISETIAEVTEQRDALAADLSQAEAFIDVLQDELGERERDLEETSNTLDEVLKLLDSSGQEERD